MRSLYFKIFSASFLITFLSPGIATSINMHIIIIIIIIIIQQFRPFCLTGYASELLHLQIELN